MTLVLFKRDKSSETLSFGANMLSFEPKISSFQQNLALSFVILEFFAALVFVMLLKKSGLCKS